MSAKVGQWYQEGEWWVRHDQTTKSQPQFRIEAIKALQWGLAGLFSKPQWEAPNKLHITAGPGPELFDVVEGYVSLENGEIICKVRFKWFSDFLLKEKTLSDIGSMAVEVAGAPSGSKEVFIVHGHNETSKEQLKNLLSALGLQPIILSEQTHRGRTIMEELDRFSTTSCFAFVIMTGDDIAESDEQQTKSDKRPKRSNKEPEKLLRARQNVILELGWFMGRLGRENVILLSQGKLELPSDVSGVLYLEFKNDVNEVAAKISRQLRDVGLL